jgi:hypothetical protein
LLEGYSVRQLSLQYLKPEKVIITFIRNILDTNKIYQIDLIFENVKYIMIDGTWISKDICLIIYYDYLNRKVIFFSFYQWERYEYIKSDLKVLRDEFKYEIECFIVDGGKQIKKAIQEICPNAKIQRCLTHIFRQIQSYISKNPQSNCWKDLQKLVTFKNFEDKEIFMKDFQNWEEKYDNFLKEKSCKWNRSWYTHRRIRQARSHMKNAIPYMFHYLDDENIKRSTNDLEWYNWVLSGHIFNHRGLEKQRLISFISLWIYERNLRWKF